MAYVLGATTADRVETGSRNLVQANMTIAMWVYVTSRVASKGLWASRSAVTNTSVVQCRLNGSGGNLEFRFGRATVSTVYITSDTPLAANAWKFIAFTIDTATAAHIYNGDMTTPCVESTYSSSTIGSGASNAETTGASMWGNFANAGAITAAVTGRFAWGQVYNRTLTLQEVDWLRLNPRGVLPGCINFVNFDRDLADLSAGGNHGYLVGGAIAPQSPIFGLVPPAKRKKFGVTAGGGGGFLPFWAARANRIIGVGYV